MTIAGNIAVIPGGRAIADSSETQGPFGRKKNFVSNGPWRCLERPPAAWLVAAVDAAAARARE
jgi:hypothetical protein